MGKTKDPVGTRRETRPVGWAKDGLPLWRKHKEGWEDGRSGPKNAEPSEFRLRTGIELAVYAAAFLLVFTLGFGAAFFTSLAFSFAANSCLTLAAMASVSTL